MLSDRTKAYLLAAMANKAAYEEIKSAIEEGSNDSLLSDISDLEAADVALSGRVDDLEAADITLDGRIGANEADIADLQDDKLAASTDASGEIAIVGLTGSEAVVAVPQEDLGTDLFLSHVIVGVDKVTIYSKDLSGATAPVDSKSFALIVIR